tara:strand:- start:285 stop:1301 length:1017 start_codon:yes stop_codon:yes gene_type:complete
MSKPTNFSYSNNLITTKQPIVNIKGNVDPVSASIVPNLSRPNTNGPTTEANANAFSGPNRKARPMKHWRRQLQPYYSSGRSSKLVSYMERPGGTVFRGIGNHCNCDASGNSLHVINNNKFLNSPYSSIKPKQNISGGTVYNNGYVQVGNPDASGSYQIDTGIYQMKNLCCTPENKVVKSAVTLLSKAYYSDSKAYLKSRCMTYEQKLSTSKLPNNTYLDACGNVLPPSDSSTGSQVYATPNCPKARGGKCEVTTTYKPNNRQFAQQGAVSSGTRLEKLKYDTVTKNGASFTSAFGKEGANAGRYHTTSQGPYFLKNKNQTFVYHRKTGNKQGCSKCLD